MEPNQHPNRCTANNKAYAQSVDFLRFGGTVVCVGIPEGQPEPIAGAMPGKMIFKAATIASTAVGNRQDAIEVLDFAARGGRPGHEAGAAGELTTATGVVKTVVRMEKMDQLTGVRLLLRRGVCPD
ncbi:MAG: hypothetical protein Q9222_001787 [Ikaeria aurantiellina]